VLRFGLELNLERVTMIKRPFFYQMQVG